MSISDEELERRRVQFEASEGLKRRQLRATMPAPEDLLMAVFVNVDAALAATPCNHTSRLTRAALQLRGLSPDVVLPWLERYGGFCDCEVLCNVAVLLEKEGDAE